MTEQYDVVIIGMGPGGEVAAARLLAAGKTVAVVERELIGGECGYWACIPSKTLLRPVELALETAATPGVTTSTLDWKGARAWRDDMIRHLDDSNQVAGYEKLGATVVRSTAHIAGPGLVEVDGHRLSCEHILVATGSSPVVPDIEGLGQCTVWTNREATNLHEIPGRVVIVGASAVAVEVSQYLRGYGAEVTIVGRGPRVLAREEPRVSELAAGHLRQQGIELRLGSAPVRAFRDGADSVLELDDGTSLAADAIVLATGRRPRSGGLGLEALDINVSERGAIKVDEHCQAGPGVWAIGDVTGTLQFTHVAKYQARIAVDTILGKPRKARYDGIPRVVFGNPEIATVGLTENQATAEGRRVRAAEVDLAAALARPWTYEREPADVALGLVADEHTDLLLGAWAVAPQASEWIHQAALAIRAEIPIETLLDQVAQFPTYSEGYLAALEELRG
jgi:pyruvate/2-oxoglutarate dehydrogenase complex dihydrolipoamide dehydrogenase (E3) component